MGGGSFAGYHQFPELARVTCFCLDSFRCLDLCLVFHSESSILDNFLQVILVILDDLIPGMVLDDVVARSRAGIFVKFRIPK